MRAQKVNKWVVSDLNGNLFFDWQLINYIYERETGALQTTWIRDQNPDHSWTWEQATATCRYQCNYALDTSWVESSRVERLLTLSKRSMDLSFPECHWFEVLILPHYEKMSKLFTKVFLNLKVFFSFQLLSTTMNFLFSFIVLYKKCWGKFVLGITKRQLAYYYVSIITTLCKQKWGFKATSVIIWGPKKSKNELSLIWMETYFLEWQMLN